MLEPVAGELPPGSAARAGLRTARRAARRVTGAPKGMFEPVMARLREVSVGGLILSGDRAEGVLLGGVRASEQPPGRGVLVGRRRAPLQIQVAEHPAP